MLSEHRIERGLASAVRSFWKTREDQAKKQKMRDVPIKVRVLL